MYSTHNGEELFQPFDGAAFFDEGGGEDVIVTVEGYADADEGGPLLSINGLLTIAQLHELTHRLTRMIAPGVTAMETAQWAMGETLQPADAEVPRG